MVFSKLAAKPLGLTLYAVMWVGNVIAPQRPNQMGFKVPNP